VGYHAYQDSGGAVIGARALATDDQGFSLVELMVVLLIVAILLAIAIASYVPSSMRAEAVACEQNLYVLNQAVLTFLMEHSAETTPALEDLRPYVSNFDGSSSCPSDGTPYEVDADTGEVTCPNHP
jgi:prepilin-type N-terminal cleavage/methylation domain-containing protein